jgi:branched-chain amino acid transport system ATP-binding protein
VNAPLLVVDSLYAGYGEANVLFDVGLNVCAGEIVALVGSNGAGKTTLLRAVSRLIASHGALSFKGVDLSRLAPEQAFALGMVHVPEGRQLFPTMTIEDNLRMGAYRRKDKPAVARSFDWVYGLFPILHQRRTQSAGSMSGGEQQMCAIARALMAAPQLLLIDEMSLGLAPVVVDQLLAILVAIRKEGVPILLVEQDVFAAFSVADRGYVLETGRIVREGPIAELEKDQRVRDAYLGTV